MNTLPPSTAGLAVAPNSSLVRSDRIARPDGRPQRSQPLMRKYEAAYLASNGDIGEISRIAPAIPAFEDSFCAFARGGLIPTDRGTVAVEDLLPGDKVKTVDNGFQTLMWCGSMMLVPDAPNQTAHMGRLTRIPADALGIGRPMPDLVLGPAARLFHRTPALQQVTGYGAAFVPARDLIDGNTVIEVTPYTPVRVYHLGFARHERFTVNGVEVESQNPGARHLLNLRGDMLGLYMSLFPHKRDLDQFGRLAYPRLSMSDIDLFNVA